MYTTTGKRRGKRQWDSAEQKRKAETLRAEWDRKLIAMEKLTPRFSTGPYNAPRKTISDFLPRTPPGRETPHIPSHTTQGGACVPVKDMTYTGTKIRGVGTMHKSNSVPIFSDQEAKDISSMRR
jgi:hypothetical protein